MSVAFRREGDDEHLEPKFEIPIPPGPNRVTARGLALIGARVAELEARLAALAGDPANEAGIVAARRDLRYWQTRQVTAELVPPPSGKTAEMGTTVTFRMSGKVKVLAIVGTDEADPAAGLLGFSAPLARVLIGAEPGDLLDFAGTDQAIEVLSVAVTA
jgi:transcription elongation GreA/GreB family factor